MVRVAKQTAVVQRSKLLEASGLGSPQARKPIKAEVCESRPVPLGALPMIQHPSEIFGLVSIEVPKQPRPETPQTLRLTMPRKKTVKTHVGYSRLLRPHLVTKLLHEKLFTQALKLWLSRQFGSLILGKRFSCHALHHACRSYRLQLNYDCLLQLLHISTKNGGYDY